MRKIKKQVKIPLMTLLLAGLLGLGNYGVSYNSEWEEPLKSQEVSPTSNSGNSHLQLELPYPGSPVVQTDHETGTCISVYDGDTITVRLAKSPQQSIKVRFIGIDTPELKKGEFGETARNYTKSLLLGQEVRLVYDIDRYDNYGRSLAYVYLEDGTFANALLLEEGFARVMTIAPNTNHAAEFNQLQAVAEEKQKGIWTMPPPPCSWRGVWLFRNGIPK